LGNPSALKVFGMIINNPGEFAATLVSNQFFSVANAGDNNYGNGAIAFQNAAPNPVLFQVTQDCFEETCVTVQQSVTPVFNPIPPLCYGDAAPALPGISVNGVSGIWLPATVSNTTSGTYLFTPNPGQCATTTNLTVNVSPEVIADGIYHD